MPFGNYKIEKYGNLQDFKIEQLAQILNHERENKKYKVNNYKQNERYKVNNYIISTNENKSICDDFYKVFLKIYDSSDKVNLQYNMFLENIYYCAKYLTSTYNMFFLSKDVSYNGSLKEKALIKFQKVMKSSLSQLLHNIQTKEDFCLIPLKFEDKDTQINYMYNMIMRDKNLISNKNSDKFFDIAFSTVLITLYTAHINNIKESKSML